MRSPQLLVPVRATSAYDCFKEVLTHLWTLWELTLLAEPTIVMGTSPLASSDAVLSLVALVSPVRQQLRARREDVQSSAHRVPPVLILAVCATRRCHIVATFGRTLRSTTRTLRTT